MTPKRLDIWDRRRLWNCWRETIIGLGCDSSSTSTSTPAKPVYAIRSHATPHLGISNLSLFPLGHGNPSPWTSLSNYHPRTVTTRSLCVWTALQKWLILSPLPRMSQRNRLLSCTVSTFGNSTASPSTPSLIEAPSSSPISLDTF